MNIRIDESLRAYIDPLTEDEHAALERSLLEEGCRDALVLWGDLLVDGHNRYGICQKHGIPFNTVQNTRFQSMEDVHLWMIDNHLGRRSVSDFQRGVLALRKKEILAARLKAREQTGAAAPQDQAPDPGREGSAGAAPAAPVHAGESAQGGEAMPPGQADHGTSAQAPGEASAGAPSPRAQAILTRQALARAARLSSATLGQIEKIHKTAAPELVEAVKAGLVSINAAAEVATLPGEAQVAAVAGGRKELRQAAKQVREARKPPKPPPEPLELPEDATAEQIEIARLTRALAEMTEERDQLRKKVQHLTIALAEARSGNSGPAF